MLSIPSILNSRKGTHGWRTSAFDEYTALGQGGTVPTSVTCPQQTMMSEPRPRFRPISEAGPWGFEDAHARCHGDGKVNEALRSIMRWLTLSSFTTYPCILRKNGQYTACRGHFMLSNGTRFSSLVLRIFKRCQGKVGQFNTIWIGQVPSFVPMISGKSLPRPDGPTFYIWPWPWATGRSQLCEQK